jgi:hypothetical protein
VTRCERTRLDNDPLDTFTHESRYVVVWPTDSVTATDIVKVGGDRMAQFIRRWGERLRIVPWPLEGYWWGAVHRDALKAVAAAGPSRVFREFRREAEGPWRGSSSMRASKSGCSAHSPA